MPLRARLARPLAPASIAAAAIFLVPAAASGQLATTGFGTGATVVRRCDIEATPLAFGIYDPIIRHAAQPLDGEARVTITCTKGTPATIRLDRGRHGSIAARELSNGSALLRYGLFKDASRTWVWGDRDPDAVHSGGAPSGAPRTFVVFGRIPPGQDIPAGAYTDSVVVTVEF